MIINKDTVLVYDENDHKGIARVINWVADDFLKVFGERPKVVTIDELETLKASSVIVAGSPKSEEVTALLYENEIDTGLLKKEDGSYKWEVFLMAQAKNFNPDIAEMLIISGSDKRGAIYGLLSVSESIGVTPFINWSDVAPRHLDKYDLIIDNVYVSKEPSVKYRGIFINDEWPAFGNWATKRFGGVNAKCYLEVFEMLLRVRGNYMWPAMWATNFSMDGPGIESAELADELGIVMSTSHHEPCMRTGEEYRLLRGPESPYGDAWDFTTNREGITKFWEDGLKRNAAFEEVITMGMRGERDTAIMANASLEENIALLKDIIRTQNDLIRKIVNPDLTKVPRQIVLFTEVEKFYYGDENTPGLIDDPEMDGITVVFSDTNYGYTRTLPTEKMLKRNGGYGMYYHVDMHGGAYSYEWIGSTYLPRIWDQLSTTYDYGVRDIWVVNVGDIVSQELEISYIMKLANNMEVFGSEHPNNYTEFVKEWVKKQFDGYFDAASLAKIEAVIHRYQLINERRKHEIMNESVYHPVHNGEALALYTVAKDVLKLCDELLEKCPEEIKTAFYELVYYPAYGTANLHRTWIASMWNKYYANQNRNTANDFCDEIDEGIKADKKLIDDFHALADGKFYGHALSEHFGFRFWNDSNNQLPTRLFVYPAYKKRMIVSKRDETAYFDGREYTKRDAIYYDFMRPDVAGVVLEVSCGSVDPITYKVESNVDWLKPNSSGGTTDKTDYIVVSIDKKNFKPGEYVEGIITITDDEGNFVKFTFPSVLLPTPAKEVMGAFFETEGEIAMEAHSAYYVSKSENAHYELLAPYGRHGSGLKLYPNTLDPMTLGIENVPFVEYRFVAGLDEEYDAEFIFAPSLPVNDSNSQCFGYAINGGETKIADTVLDKSRPIFNSPQWADDNKKNAKCIHVSVRGRKGLNALRYFQLSPNLILERIVLRSKNMPHKESYLGPVESFRFI